MTPTPRSTKGKRLAYEGWAWVEGWLPKDEAYAVQQQFQRHRYEAEALAAKPRPRGRPRRQPGLPLE